MFKPHYPNSRGLARIGAVTPISNSNLEPDLALLAPPGCSIHIARAGGYDLDAIPDADQMRKFALSSLDGVIADLAAVRPDVILYGCTSATLAHGPEFDREFAEKITEKTGIPAFTAAGSLIAAMGHVGLKTFAFTSPYTAALNADCIAFLEACDFQCVQAHHVEEDLGNYGQGAVTPDAIYDMAVKVDHDRADAVILSCTDFRAVEAIPAIREALKKPVITSNQAMMWQALQTLSVDKDQPDWRAHIALS